MNLGQGHGLIEIRTPKEVLYEEEESKIMGRNSKRKRVSVLFDFLEGYYYDRTTNKTSL